MVATRTHDENVCLATVTHLRGGHDAWPEIVAARRTADHAQRVADPRHHRVAKPGGADGDGGPHQQRGDQRDEREILDRRLTALGHAASLSAGVSRIDPWM